MVCSCFLAFDVRFVDDDQLGSLCQKRWMRMFRDEERIILQEFQHRHMHTHTHGIERAMGVI
jgi:hypothetical protein